MELVAAPSLLLRSSGLRGAMLGATTFELADRSQRGRAPTLQSEESSQKSPSPSLASEPKRAPAPATDRGRLVNSRSY